MSNFIMTNQKLKKPHFCLPEFYSIPPEIEEEYDDYTETYQQEYLKCCEQHVTSVAGAQVLISDTLIGSDLFDDYERRKELESIIWDLSTYLNDKFI